MLSTFLELAGLGMFAVAAFLLGGTVALLFVVGVELLLVGFAAEGVRAGARRK